MIVLGLSLAAVPSAVGSAPEEQQARRILETTGVTGGLVVHVGCGDGKLTAALCAGDNYLAHGLDGDAKHVNAARKYLQSLGLADKVSVEQWSAKQLPYANNLVNLVVAENLGQIAMDEVMRVLAPLGVAYVKAGVTWTKTVKPWPKEIDEWTHYLHGPDNNAVAHDTLVGPPTGVQWVEGPFWQRHHQMNANPNALVSARGRIFYIVDEAPATVAGLPDQWVLVARDAFNGVLLWKRPVPDWGWKAWSADEEGGRFNLPLHIPRRLVAAGDRIFVTLGFNAPLSVLDAATGKTIKTYEGTQFTDEILFHEGLLVLTVNEAPQQADPSDLRRKKRKTETGAASTNNSPGVKKRVVVLKADTGEIVWSKTGFSGVSSSPTGGHILKITRLLTAVGSGKVVCVEKDALVALDFQTGHELWRTPRPRLAPNPPSLRENLLNFSTVVIHQDVVVFLQTEQSYKSEGSGGDNGVRCKVLGLSADTGNVLWTQRCSKWGPASEGDVFVINDLVWTHHVNDFALIGIDLHSGQITRTISTKEAFDEVHHHRCVRNKATEHYILTERRGIEAIDLFSGKTSKNEWTRGACRYGIMPCNGLIYVPPHPCECYIDVKLSGFFALSSSVAAPISPVPHPSRLEKGPAFEEIRHRTSDIRTADDWPTYRHDLQRSGATGAAVPTDLKRLWEARLGARVSACTIAGGRVFAAAVDQHRVVALDAKSGQVVWDYTVGGRVDTPPTIYRGSVLFGSADGWVYCLRAADGVLAWRFCAAPAEQRIVALGQLESLWPVHGTVLVINGVAYVAAGRSTHLDGGIRVYALKADSGELIRELKPLNGQTQGLEDVLVGEGDIVYMRHLEFSLKANAKPSPLSRRAYSTAGLLDDSRFARVGWTTKDEIGAKGKSLTGMGKAADLLVFDKQSTFAFRSQRSGGFGGWFQVGTGAYELTATDNQLGKPRWTAKIPVRVQALAIAGPVLFAAGPRDTVDAKDPWASVQGRAGSVLCVFASADGKKLAEYPLDVVPAWDGLAIGNNKLFLSTLNGKVVCLGQ